MTTEQKARPIGVARQAAWLTAANLIGFAISFLTPLILVRTLSQSEFGVYKQLFQILATTTAVLNLQMASSAYYFVPRAPDKKTQILINIIAFYTVVGALVAAAFFLYPQWAAIISQDPALISRIPLLGLAIFLWLISANLEVIPLALGDARASAGFIVLAQATKSALMLGAALVFKSIESVLWAVIFQAVVQTAAMLIYLTRRTGGFSLPDWSLFKSQLANSIPYGIGGVAQGLQGDLHNYFVSHFFSAASFAVYSVGCFQLPLLTLIQNSLVSVLIPEMSRLSAKGDYDHMVREWMDAVRKLSLIFLPTCVFLFVIKSELITLLFTNAYLESVPIFAVYLVNILLLALLTGPILRAFDDLKFFRLKLNLALLPITAVSLYLGIKSSGLLGAIAAAVLIQSLDSAVTFVTVARRVRMGAKDLHFGLPILKISAAAATAGVGAAAAKSLVQGGQLLMMLAAGAVFGAIYLTIVLWTDILTNEEKTRLSIWKRGYL